MGFRITHKAKLNFQGLQGETEYPSVLSATDRQSEPLPERITRYVQSNGPVAVGSDALVCNEWVRLVTTLLEDLKLG